MQCYAEDISTGWDGDCALFGTIDGEKEVAILIRNDGIMEETREMFIVVNTLFLTMTVDMLVCDMSKFMIIWGQRSGHIAYFRCRRTQ